jgi:hypothetical protein
MKVIVCDNIVVCIPLLVNDGEISNYITVAEYRIQTSTFPRQEFHCYRGELFSVRSVPRCFRPFVRQGVRQRQQISEGVNIWSQVPQWARHQDVLAD